MSHSFILTLHGGKEIVLELDIEPVNGAFSWCQFKMADLFYTPEKSTFPSISCHFMALYFYIFWSYMCEWILQMASIALRVLDYGFG